MIEVRYKARLGNNLFQYCLGRILAEHLGYALKAEALDGFSRTKDAITGAQHNSPEQVLEGQRIDLGAVLNDSSPRKIVLNGWFQRQEYFTPHRTRIQQWLRIDAKRHVHCLDAELVVNVRRTDFIGLGWALPFAWYEEAIETALPHKGRVAIVTDDPYDPFFRKFRRWRPHFFLGNPVEQISYMATAPRFVMSASTFSWWPTFLGTPQLVVCPVPTYGAWSPTGEAADSNLIERDRFICIECNDAYIPTVTEQKYQHWRLFKRRVILGLNRHLHLGLTEPAP